MRSDLFQLTGKTALVTGGGSGLGRAICCGFSDAGARVVAADISLANAEQTASLVKEGGGEAQAEELDVTKKADVEDVVERAIRNGARLTYWLTPPGERFVGPLSNTPKKTGTPSSM